MNLVVSEPVRGAVLVTDVVVNGTVDPGAVEDAMVLTDSEVTSEAGP